MTGTRTAYRRRSSAARAPRRESPAIPRADPPRRSGGRSEPAPALGPNVLRLLICGALFVTLVTLKLLLPGPMTAVRGTLSSWLVRDADFEEAFSSVGRAVSGEGGMLDSLGEAYVAVFGSEAAKEVSAPAAIPAEEPAEKEKAAPAEAAAAEPAPAGTEPTDARDYPERAAVGQRVLGFAHAAPLSGEITSSFGWREHPVTGTESFHYGIDIAAEEGAEVRCFADGAVGVVGESTELGRYVTVSHDNGFTTLYAHLKRAAVSSGESVKLGQRLGEAGSTGNATGPHLHFEIHDGEDYLDPIYYIS